MPKQNITILGKPIAKNRPRFSRRGKHVVTYSDQGDDRDRISTIVAAQSTIGSIITTAVTVSMRFWFERPKSHFRAGKYAGFLKPSAPEKHIVKPDVDNTVKWICDILNGIVWKDDAQVTKLVAEKMYVTTGEARTEIVIEY